MALPEFRMHGFDRKFDSLPESVLAHPYPSAVRIVDLLKALVGDDLSSFTVLDVGCGRGELVAELRRLGARAFGIEIDPRFVDSGKLLEQHYSDSFPILSVIGSEGKSLFPDGFFDLVVSDQVLEHVANLRSVATEIGRVLRPGGLTCHQFPARFRIVEPHYRLAFTHWLPKGNIRREAIRLMLMAGFAKQFFPELDLADRIEIIFRYSVDETFYRPPREIDAAFRRAGMAPTTEGIAAYARRRAGRLGGLPRVANLIAGVRMMTFTARKPQSH